MADINTGFRRSFERGSQILFGTDRVLNVISGSVSVEFGIRERRVGMADNQDSFGSIPVGPRRRTRISFDVGFVGDSTVDDILAPFMDTATSTAAPSVNVSIRLSEDSATGAETDTIDFGACVLEDNPTYQAGEEQDTISMTLLTEVPLPIAFASSWTNAGS